MRTLLVVVAVLFALSCTEETTERIVTTTTTTDNQSVCSTQAWPYRLRSCQRIQYREHSTQDISATAWNLERTAKISPYLRIAFVNYSGYVTGPIATDLPAELPAQAGWSNTCRVGLSPTGDPRLFTAH